MYVYNVYTPPQNINSFHRKDEQFFFVLVSRCDDHSGVSYYKRGATTVMLPQDFAEVRDETFKCLPELHHPKIPANEKTAAKGRIFLMARTGNTLQGVALSEGVKGGMPPLFLPFCQTELRRAMRGSVLDAVVVGAGQAGLAVSYYLKQQELEHIVLERGRIGESWRAQRWDSFVLNSPNHRNVLPGDTYTGTNPDGFDSGHAFVSYLQHYAMRHRLSVYENSPVVSVNRQEDGFVVEASESGTTRAYKTRRVVIASGAMNEKKIPSFARDISSEVSQYHTSEYRNPSQLPQGAILVVGSGQSGLQVAEELIEAGRTVYLSTSAVGRLPRRYRGMDILDWLLKIGFYDVKTEDVTDPNVFAMKPPQVSGVGPLGHTHSLQSLARSGAIILGRVEGAKGDYIYLQPNAAKHVMFADEISSVVKQQIEQFITANHLSPPPPDADPADEPDPKASCACSITLLNMKESGISSIIWTTGFSCDYNYLPLPVFNESGKPKHCRGLCEMAGIYFIGLPWLRKRKSGIICGIDEDANFVVEAIKSAS